MRNSSEPGDGRRGVESDRVTSNSALKFGRPVLRPMAGLFLASWTAWSAYVAVWPTSQASIPAADWWIPPLSGLLFAGIYLYASSRLELRGADVRITNAMWRVDIPLAAITDAEPGSNLALITRDRRYVAWGVEASNLDSWTMRRARQERIASEILRAVADAPPGEAEPARYRFVGPGPLATACTLTLFAIGCLLHVSPS